MAGQAAQAVLDRNQSLAVMAMPDKQSIAQQALGGQAGGIYLAPALYKPVLQARHDLKLHVPQLAGCSSPGGEGSGTCSALKVSEPVDSAPAQFVEGAMKALAAAADGGSAARPGGGEQANRALLDYLEAFVSDEFLPDVYVDFRRATNTLLRLRFM